MEATGDAAGLLDKIVPPRLEDAGLEDCALPPESIKEAFLKAATAVRSHIFSSSSDDDGESDVNDPWTGLGDADGDKLVGMTPEDDPPGACAAKKSGGLPAWTGDDVVVPGVSHDGEDKVLGLPKVPNEGEAIIDGLEGLHIGEKQPTGESKKTSNENDGEKDEERKGHKPILVEGFV